MMRRLLLVVTGTGWTGAGRCLPRRWGEIIHCSTGIVHWIFKGLAEKWEWLMTKMRNDAGGEASVVINSAGDQGH